MYLSRIWVQSFAHIEMSVQNISKVCIEIQIQLNVGIQFGIMYLNRIWVRMSRTQTRCLGKGRKAEEKTRQKEKKK